MVALPRPFELSAGEPFADVASTVPRTSPRLCPRLGARPAARSRDPALALAPLRFLRGHRFAPPRWPPRRGADAHHRARQGGGVRARVPVPRERALGHSRDPSRDVGALAIGGPSRDRVRRPRDPRARPRRRSRPRARRPQAARETSPAGTPRRCPRRGESRARTPLTPIQARTNPRARPRVRRRRPSVRRPTPPRGSPRARPPRRRRRAPGNAAGLYALVAEQIFDEISRSKEGLVLRAGFFEIYRGKCARVRPLTTKKKRIEVMEDDKGHQRARCSWRSSRPPTRCYSARAAPTARRAPPPRTTSSSRSHAILHPRRRTRARRPRRRRRRGTRWHRRRTAQRSHPAHSRRAGATSCGAGGRGRPSPPRDANRRRNDDSNHRGRIPLGSRRARLERCRRRE